MDGQRQMAHWDDGAYVSVEHMWRVVCQHYSEEVKSINLHVGR